MKDHIFVSILVFIFSGLAASGIVFAGNEEVVGSTKVVISNANAFCSESALGDVVADAVKLLSGADFAIVFCGDLDLYLPAGDLTLEDVKASVPNNSSYSEIYLSVDQIVSILEEGLGHIVLTESEEMDYSASLCNDFPQISGFSIRCDSSAPIGERVLSITTDTNAKIDPNDTEKIFSVALPSSALDSAQLEYAESLGGIRNIFLEYLSLNSPLAKPDFSRISIIGAHANPLISSAPVIMIGIVILICAVMAIPSILRKKKNLEEREEMYFTGTTALRNKLRK